MKMDTKSREITQKRKKCSASSTPRREGEIRWRREKYKMF